VWCGSTHGSLHLLSHGSMHCTMASSRCSMMPHIVAPGKINMNVEYWLYAVDVIDL
jgi:hypothetical protein